MQLKKQANYALRTLIYCASNPDKQSRIAEIARVYGVSELSLFKFIKPLVDNGLLITSRGRHGGVKLGRPASDITMLEVVRITEDNFMLAECFEGSDSDCPLIGSCDVNLALHEALDAFFAVLEKYTIADLAQRQTHLRQLLNLDRQPDLQPAIST